MAVARIFRIATLTFLAIAILAAPATLRHAAASSTDMAQADLLGQLLDVEDRMNLSAKQKEEIRPILNRSVHRRIEVLREFGLEGGVAEARFLTPRQKWSIIRQLHQINEETENKLSEYLYPSQMQVYREAEDNFRHEMEQRIADRMAQ